MNWRQLRTDLFNTMENRREKFVTFRFEQIHGLIVDSSFLFTKPGTREAKEARERIQNEGTFLMVADSLRDFLKLFTPAQTPTQAEQSELDPTLQTLADARRNPGNPFRQNQDPAPPE